MSIRVVQDMVDILGADFGATYIHLIDILNQLHKETMESHRPFTKFRRVNFILFSKD